MSAELLLVEQRHGDGNAAHWILEGGQILPGVDDNRRMVSELVPTGVEPTFAPQLEERGVHLPDAMKAPPVRT